MKAENQNRKADCARGAEAAAYLADELSPEERLAFEAHLAGCAACRDRVARTRQVLARLASVPQATASRDLAPEVLARLGPQAFARAKRFGAGRFSRHLFVAPFGCPRWVDAL